MSFEPAALAALLVAGHTLGDFVFQTKWMVERKDRWNGLLAHGVVVAACHAAAIAPFMNERALVAVLATDFLHLLIDAAKSRLVRMSPRRGLFLFALDQVAHLAVLAVAWVWLAPQVTLHPMVPWDAATLATIGILVSAYAFNVNGMSAVVVGVLVPLGIAPREEGPAVGRVIGILERAFALTLVLHSQWSALGFLVAAKSLARFKDLEDRKNAEYYLVGTLVSLLGATVSAIAANALIAGR